MEYDFDEELQVKGVCSMKRDWYEFSLLFSPERKSELPMPEKDFINMGIADMDFPVAQPILDALHKRIDARCLGYTYSFEPEYKKLVCDWAEKRYDWELTPEKTTVALGVLEALEKAISFTVPRGKKILITTPGYSSFSFPIHGAQCEIETTALVNTNGYFTVDWKDFEQKVSDPDVAGFLLCNPHNPTGRVWTEEELRHMGELCFANHVFVFSDEIHCDFVRADNKHIPFGKVFPEEKNWIACFSPGKTFNLSGLTYANVVIPDEKLMQKWSMAVGVLSTNVLSMEACRAAYTSCEDWLIGMRKYIDKNMEFTKKYLAEHLPKAVFEIPEGTYFAWIDLTAYHIDVDMHTFFFKLGLELEGGDGFSDNPRDRSFIRLVLGCTRRTLEIALSRMCNAIKKEK